MNFGGNPASPQNTPWHLPLDPLLVRPLPWALLLGNGALPKISIFLADITGRIFDRLVQRFGCDAVFRDIDNIRPGIDFRKQIAEVPQTINVFLVIVGPRWFGCGAKPARRRDRKGTVGVA
jgi:hypothetical protein